MSQLTAVILNVSATSNIATVTNGVDVSRFVVGDYVFFDTVSRPFAIQAINDNQITLNENAPITSSSVEARVAPSVVELRALADDIRDSNVFASNIFGQLDFFLTQLGAVDIESASGTTRVNTLPQILFDVSQASNEISDNLALINNAPLIAQQSADSASQSAASALTASQQAVLAGQQASKATEERQATISVREETDAIRLQTQGLVDDADTAAFNAAQSVLEAVEEVVLAQQQVALAVAQRNATAVLRNDTQGFRDATQQFAIAAQQAVQAVSGGMFFAGEFDASLGINPPNPSDGTAFYKITTAGVIDGIDYGVNDNIVFNNIDNTWFKVDNTESVSSVNGMQGAVSLNAADVGALPTTFRPTFNSTDIVGLPSEFNPAPHSASLVTSGVLAVLRGGTGRNDGKAPSLVTARTITATLSGDVTGTAGTSFDGSANRTISINANINKSTASTANTVAQRDSSGDLSARLFRSEYDVTNPAINFIMTQVDTGAYFHASRSLNNIDADQAITSIAISE